MEELQSIVVIIREDFQQEVVVSSQLLHHIRIKSVFSAIITLG